MFKTDNQVCRINLLNRFSLKWMALAAVVSSIFVYSAAQSAVQQDTYQQGASSGLQKKKEPQQKKGPNKKTPSKTPEKGKAPQKPVTKPAPPTPPAPPSDDEDMGGPEPYDKVITKKAKSQTGVFAVHQIGHKVLWEIPDDMLGREFLWHLMLSQVASGSNDFSAPGLNLDSQVIKFEKHGNSLWLRKMDYSVRSQPESGEAAGVALTNVMPIIHTFPIEAYNKKAHTMVINVSRLYLAEPSGMASMLLGSGINPTASTILSVDDFPENIEASVQLTFSSGGGSPFGGSGRIPPSLAALFDTGPKTTVVHYSLDLLPKVPMTPRLADPRVGFFDQPFSLYGSNDNMVVHQAYIDRFNLVKKHPDEAVSDPVKPIVFYLSREIPAVWRPYVRKAVLAWNPVFEAAGYSHALEVKDAPTKKEDPKWSPEDVRYSVIRWATTPTENAEGQSIQDPRSGQTLSGKVVVWYNVLKLAQDWYFAQAAACDPNARKLPMSPSTLGPILTYILTHEVGHTLGLAHNFKASAQYPTAMLRSASFTAKYGDEASIMDYGRFNYVAQPGDGARLIPIIGPYDYFAIKYGYMPPLAVTPEAERPALDHYLSQDVTNKYDRFGNSNPIDPEMETEDLGNDPILSSTYGLKNIDRISNYLLDGTIHYGHSFRLLSEAYGALTEQRMLELLHVMKLVGGVHENNFFGGHVNVVYRPVSKARQQAAVAFLMSKGIHFPKALMNPLVLDKIQQTGNISTAVASAGIIINGLLNEGRVQRMFDNQAMNGSNAYTVASMVSQMQSAIWNQLHQNHPVISLYQANVQDMYLKAMNSRLNGDSATQTQLKGIAMLSLMRLQNAIGSSLKHVQDDATKAHLIADQAEIKKILKGEPMASVGPGIDLASLLGGISPDICGYGDVPNLIKGALGK